MSTIRMTGMVSGLDTEAIVSAMVSTQRSKKEKIEKKKTLLEWKQDAYKSINTKVYSLYTSVSNYRFSSAYSLKKTTVSDSTKATVTASSSAVNGTQTLKINQLAKSGYLTGAKLSNSTAKTTLSDLGYTGDDTTITVGASGSATNITLTKDMTISDVVSALGKAGVNASYDSTNQRIFVSSKSTGADNDFTLTADTTDGLSALQALGISVSSSSDTSAYQTLAALAATTTDDDGNTVLDEDTTLSNITSQLKTLRDAYAENEELTLANSELNSKITYTNAYNALYDSDLYNGLSDDDKEKYQTLVSLVNSSYTKYSYFTKDEDGNDDYSADYKTVYEFTASTDTSTIGSNVKDTIESLAKELGIIGDDDDIDSAEAFTTFKSNASAIKGKSYDDYYLDDDALTAAKAQIETNNDTIAANKETISEYSLIDVGDYSDYTTDDELTALAQMLTDKITTAYKIVSGEIDLSDYASDGATRVAGQDAKIVLNGAEFESSSNSFTINGLTIKTTAVTDDDEELTISTDTDTQGLYDKIKELLSTYNTVINELTSLYNADSASGYEPLTDDEKEEMSDSEIEKWETKIKDALLRKDSTIGNVMSAMTSAMSKTYTIDGQTYALSSFGIHTLGYLNASANEYSAYHIDGDSEDSSTGDNTDKLMAMIESNPDAVESFMKQLASGLYTALGNQMKSTTLSSAYTIYNDKQITKDLASYTTSISDWEDRIEDLEDRYYSQFSSMETQLSTLESSSSSISSLLGS